ncbi:ABC-type antimicrobial peptide transport system permease subunit [Sporosarcina luteola]|nr:ABC-type antimicrobial peptide transport system permease subunit [Sporosarcina luteola]
MFLYLKSSLRERWPLFLILILVINTASLGYIGSKSVTERMIMQARDDLSSNWRYHYDLLVVPAVAEEVRGLPDGWVPPHTTIASYGGISIEELELIRGIPGVETAAPLSIIGYSTVNGIDMEYTDVVPGSFYEIRHIQEVFDGLKTYILSDQTDLKRYVPFGTANDAVAYQIAMDLGRNIDTQVIGVELKKPNELLIVAIDPVAENELFTFSESLEGSFHLEEAEMEEDTGQSGVRMIPAVKLATNKTEMKETIVVKSIEIPQEIISSDAISQHINRLERMEEARITVNSFQNRWNRKHVALDLKRDSTYTESNITMFASSSVDVYHYQPIQYDNMLTGEDDIPVVQVIPFEQDGVTELSIYRQKVDTMKKGFGIDVINYYHPERVKPVLNKSWSIGEPLDVYTPHQSSIIKDGEGNSLSPTPLLPLPLKNTYFTGSPDLITTMEAAAYFYGSRPPISSVRIAVKGVAERSAESQRKIEDTAAQIRALTGHRVEVMLGSSASKVHIDLGNRGKELPGIVEESWQQAGMNWAIQERIERSNQIVYCYVLFTCIFFCFTMITHSLLHRRRDFAMLRTMGWPRRNVAKVLLMEILGLSTLSVIPLFMINSTFHILNAVEMIALVVTIPLVITIGYGAGARKSFQKIPRHALDSEVSEWKLTRIIPIRGLFGYSLCQMVRRPVRFGFMFILLALTSFMVILFIATRTSISEFLFLSFIGETINLNISGSQMIFLWIGVFLSLLFLMFLLYLNITERRGEYTTLRAIGWSVNRLRFYSSIEVLLLTTFGSAIGVIFAYAFIKAYSTINISTLLLFIIFLAPVVMLFLLSLFLMKVLKVERVNLRPN